ncbi:hypothetical protein HK105_207804 [Polyrhizophydium stewartii]|uniref:Ankyrin repeat protein n=1 Tax=Polyrhizophydium stewartii TaxID=2732419 RepID=A0ABR4MZL0_9FUNG
MGSVQSRAAPTSVLPWGCSLWDRLPKDVRQRILAVSDLVLETGWRSGLCSLPPVDRWSQAFFAIRSRAVFHHVAEAGLAHPVVLQRVAIRNQWVDLIDYATPNETALAAAWEGCIGVLEKLVAAWAVGIPASLLADYAAAGGHLATVQWLFARFPAEQWSFDDIHGSAARSGNIRLVAWLRSSCPDSWSDIALVEAASKGHGDIVRLLASHGYDPFPEIAARVAAEHGHMDVLEFLCQEYPRHVARMGSQDLGNVRLVPALQFLHAHGIISRPRRLLTSFVRSGNVDCARWVHETFGTPLEQSLLVAACMRNRAGMVRWLLQHSRMDVSAKAVSVATERGAVDVLVVLIEHDPGLARAISARAAELNDRHLVEWMHVRHPGSVTQHTIDTAARYGSSAVIEYIVSSLPDAEWGSFQSQTLAKADRRSDPLDLRDFSLTRLALS